MKALLPTLAGLLLLPATAIAQGGDTIHVSADDDLTISAAIEAAAPGDTILIGPGVYPENLVIDKPLTLRGEGERGDVVIAPAEALPERREVPDTDEPVVTHVFVDGVDVTIEHLSLGEDERIQASLMLRGGEHRVQDIDSAHIIGVNGDVDATIEGSQLNRIIVMGTGAAVDISDSTISDGMVAGMGSTASVRDSLIVDGPIDVYDDARLEAIGNVFRPAEGAPAIWVNWTGGSASVVDNVIEGAWQGVMVEHGASVHIEGNTITDPEFGIHVVETGGVVRDNVVSGAGEVGIVIAGNGTTVEDNTVSGGRIGMQISMPNGYPPGAPRWDDPSVFKGNDVTGSSHFGVLVSEAAPVISGNRICSERQPLELRNEASPQLGTNEICEVSG